MSTEPNKQEFVSASKDANKQNTELVLWSAMTASGLEISALNSGAMKFNKNGIAHVIPADDLYALVQNKQPPAEAGEGAVAWRVRGLTDWIDGAPSKDQLEFEAALGCGDVQIAYSSQTTATQAAVAAAMRKFAEVLLAEIKANYGTASVSDGPLWHSIVNNSIPAEATAALDAYEALKLDAERYRWLKENYHGFEQYRSGVVPYITLDSEVDAAIVRDVLNKNREE
jgi:hypothetical protein